MDTTTYIGLSHLSSLRREMDMIANNLANQNTPAYKAEKPLFTWFLNKADNSFAAPKVAYVEDFGNVRNLSVGTISPTGNPLDIAINGEGYFTIQTPEGERYTRMGAFNLNADRQIVTRDGHPLLDENGAVITVPEGENNLTLSGDGTLSAGNQPLTRIVPVQFENERDLQKLPGGFYETEQQPQALADFELRQGMLEGSNVQAVLEMTNMIDVSRSYASAKQFVDKEDERVRTAIRKLAGNE